MSVQIAITVANAASLVAQGHTRIEVWVSADKGNSYQEITSSTDTAAYLTSSPANTTFDMNGDKLLKFSINGATEQSVTFSGSPVRYWTPLQVMNHINTATATSIASLNGNSVVLTVPSVVGRNTTMLITYNDATDLGFTAGDFTTGTDARITLSGSTFVYTYIDLSGAVDYKYKWRFSANGVNPISDYSSPVNGDTVPYAVPISIGTAYFVGIDGRPQQRTIIVGVDDVPFVSSGFAVGNELVQTYTSDINGFIQVPLIQGAKIRIGIEGTSYTREIIVPSTSTFDIMAAMATAADPFTIRVPPPFLTRRGP
jgi:hypothetical protein